MARGANYVRFGTHSRFASFSPRSWGEAAGAARLLEWGMARSAGRALLVQPIEQVIEQHGSGLTLKGILRNRKNWLHMLGSLGPVVMWLPKFQKLRARQISCIN